MKFVSSVEHRAAVTPSKLLLALGALLGVLLMHGVGADHAMPMASAATMSDSGGLATTSDHQQGMAGSEKLAVLSAPIPGHPMTAMCVAILAGGLSLSLLAGLRPNRRRGDRRLDLPRAAALAPDVAKAWWLAAPSLTRLCVSRT